MTAAAIADEARWMARALELASRGEGYVEPNPMVGCVVVKGDRIVGEGWHRRFGRSHAEVHALHAAGNQARGATLYVTLEPCCHVGKTPPCTEAIVAAGVGRVVAATRDPFPAVDGGGIEALAAAGVECRVGLMESESRRLLAPYLMRIQTGRPWVIAKWAMTLDGKIATRTGDSRWISGDASRQRVHQLRGRVDAIMVGSRTARLDDPQLTARPADPTDLKRLATRVVVDLRATLPTDSQLARSAHEVPVLLAVGDDVAGDASARLDDLGVEIWPGRTRSYGEVVARLLTNLAQRGMTNVLVEGGGQLVGELFDQGAIDEVHVFVAPRLVGSSSAPSPVAGTGVERMAAALRLMEPVIESLDEDVYIHGRLH